MHGKPAAWKDTIELIVRRHSRVIGKLQAVCKCPRGITCAALYTFTGGQPCLCLVNLTSLRSSILTPCTCRYLTVCHAEPTQVHCYGAANKLGEMDITTTCSSSTSYVAFPFAQGPLSSPAIVTAACVTVITHLPEHSVHCNSDIVSQQTPTMLTIHRPTLSTAHLK